MGAGVDVYDFINQTTVLISMILLLLVFIEAFQMKTHNRKIRFYMSTVAICLGGLMFNIIYQEKFAYVMYSLVMPTFTLYFIETEREDNEGWDGLFWMSLQFLISILVIVLVTYGGGYLAECIAFLTQYIVVTVMLLISAKQLSASFSFLISLIFPIIAVFAEMIDWDVKVLGLGVSLMLLIVFFGYQTDMERELMENRVELSENKVSLLMEQIHPHFIYNALQQIALLSDEDPTQVKPAILSFSSYLRKNFEALTNEKLIPFEKELEHVDAYVKLSEVLPSRNFTIKKDFKVTDFNIPALTLQPLVENAIYYGIGMSEEGDEIRIETKEEKGYIVISVSDDGHGKKTEISTQKKHKSVGTANVKTRLKLLCDGELEINKSSNGTSSIIRMPKDRVITEKNEKK